MIIDERREQRIAVLIDAENVSARYIKLILDEASNYGIVTYKRLYGDFQIPSVKNWMKNLQEYAITPVFQYNYTHGKNASDSALIIDAMDILYSGNVDGFCIVTSDSDFTKLVLRLRESGMTVVGMGEQKTPPALVAACETFKFLDILYRQETKKNTAKKKQNAKKNRAQKTVAAGQTPGETVEASEAVEAAENEILTNGVSAEDGEKGNIPDLDEMEKEVISIIDNFAGDDGWVDLSELGDNLPKRVPGFDPRNYGCAKLRPFIEKFDSLEIRSAQNPHNAILTVIYVRVKQETAEEEEREQNGVNAAETAPEKAAETTAEAKNAAETKTAAEAKNAAEAKTAAEMKKAAETKAAKAVKTAESANTGDAGDVTEENKTEDSADGTPEAASLDAEVPQEPVSKKTNEPAKKLQRKRKIRKPRKTTGKKESSKNDTAGDTTGEPDKKNAPDPE